ncbi:MAG TPA: histidine phosphatase family protein [Gaiellaceae bacterium]|jgi:probable phosphoglycerate mutase|nr:histidine phosphatase family protein [Gaiellaceae bacterium]
MSTPTTRLVLVRHGESVAQVEGFLSGHDTCRGLSGHGRRQVGALRDRLLATGELGTVDSVFTSILERTIETAAILAPVLGNRPPSAECDWCELHVGEAEGLTWEEFRGRYPGGDAWDPFLQLSPGAESWAEFFVRAGARLRRVAFEHAGETVVVVCHGGIVGASFVALGDLPIHQGPKLVRETVNASLTEWCHDGNGWRLGRFNDAAHVAALDAVG